MNSDDPKFTARVLGECADLTAAERAEFEALIASDPAAATEAAKTQALAARLRAELPGEAAAGLEDRQRAAVLNAAASVATDARVVPFPRRTTALAAIAASLVVGVTAALVFHQLRDVPAGNLPGMTQNLSENSMAMAMPKISNPEAIAGPMPPAVPGQQVQFGNISLTKSGAEHASMASMETAGKSHLDATALNRVSPNIGATIVDAGISNVASGTFVTTTIRTTISGTLNSYAGSTVTIGTISASAAVQRPKAELATRNLGDGFSAAEAGELANFNDPRAGKDFSGAVAGLVDSIALSFDAVTENAFLNARENPVSTFGFDAETASYAIVRRFLEGNQRPPPDTVRIEELLNYFAYDYPPPQGDAVFSATMEVAECPWAPEHWLVRIGLKGRELSSTSAAIARDVQVEVQFNPAQVGAYRLIGYEKRSLAARDSRRDEKYAGEISAGHTVTALYELAPAGKELPPLAMLRMLKDQPARRQLREKDLEETSEHLSRKAGAAALTPAAAAPAPAPPASAPAPKQKGAPQNATPKLLILPAPEPEARAATPQLLPPHEPKPLPEAVPAPRDGQPELLPPHVPIPESALRPEPKQKPVAPYLVEQEPRKPVNLSTVGATTTPTPLGREMLTLKLRYKALDGDTSRLLVFPLTDSGTTWEKSSPDFRFAAAVAGYGMLLRDSSYRGQITWESVAEWAREGLVPDVSGRRAEFLNLIEKAKAVSR